MVDSIFDTSAAVTYTLKLEMKCGIPHYCVLMHKVHYLLPQSTI